MKAVIDLGTNTFHLLIAETAGQAIKVIHKHHIPVKIGKGGVHKGELTSDAIQRAFEALNDFAQRLEIYSVSEIQVFGTSAIRDAANGKQFMEDVYNRFGFHIQAISGLQEAEFIFKGVQASLPVMHETYVIMDIGGGSVEFIVVDGGQAVWKQSYQTGVSRLIHSFPMSDPLSDNEIQNLEDHFAQSYQTLTDIMRKYKPRILVGSAGSFETISDILEKDRTTPVTAVTPYAFELPLLPAMECMNMLIHSSHAERSQLSGLVSFRMEMIASAALMTRWVMTQYSIKMLIASMYSLKEGALVHS